MVESAFEEEVSDSFVGESDFDDDDAGEEPRELEKYGGDGRDEGVSEGMDGDDAFEGHSFEDGGSDVGSVHDFDHGSACDSCDIPEVVDDEDEYG